MENNRNKKALENHTIVVDLSYMKTLIGENEEVVSELIGLLCEHIPDITKDIHRFWLQKDFKLLQKAAHKIKSNISLLNITDYRETIESIERYAGEESHHELLPDLIQKAVLTSHEVIRQLKKEQEKINNAA